LSTLAGTFRHPVKHLPNVVYFFNKSTNLKLDFCFGTIALKYSLTLFEEVIFTDKETLFWEKNGDRPR
jgi:hypothetical protein